jgi:diguanylate cyclase (GGDEF)-like protein
MERLGEEINRSERNNSHQVAVLMLDLDNFKKINDRYGHAVGDQVLKHFSSILRKELRKIDTVGRLGGEEFGIFLPETSLSDAGIFAERLRQELAQTPLLTDGQSIVTTVSIGISELMSKDIQADSVLIRADQALYRAKKNGRNRVEFYNGS